MNFEDKLDTLAQLAVTVGVALQPGQKLVIQAPVECAPLARACVRRAYQAGARLVDVLWVDDDLTLSRFTLAPADSFNVYPAWRAEAMQAMADEQGAVIYIRGEDPELLAGVNPDSISAYRTAEAKALREYNEQRDLGAVNWTIIGGPTLGWAKRVFPNDEPGVALEKLWDAVFAAARADRENAVGAWSAHIKNLLKWSAYLNERRYDALHFTGPGTDLTIGLPEGHEWRSAQFVTKYGLPYTANIPTEEVFTMPHRLRVEGTVSSTKPLNYGGSLIDGVNVKFEGGRVVAATAKRGQAVLERILDTDEGARRLGEVALVPNSSPISRSGVLFHHTLFDENAACHIAVGRSYHATLTGSESLSAEEYAAAGGNDSLLHVDWMIGSGEVSIDGLKGEAREPVMRQGEFTF